MRMRSNDYDEAPDPFPLCPCCRLASWGCDCTASEISAAGRAEAAVNDGRAPRAHLQMIQDRASDRKLGAKMDG